MCWTHCVISLLCRYFNQQLDHLCLLIGTHQCDSYPLAETTGWGNILFDDCISKGLLPGLQERHAWFVKLAVQFSRSVMSSFLQPHGLQHTRLPCPSSIPGACSNSCPWSRWWYRTISSSVVLISSCLQSFPASGSFPMSQFFAVLRIQRIGASASASVLPLNFQDCFCLGQTGLISLQSKGLSRVFSNTTVQKHQFFGAQFSL